MCEKKNQYEIGQNSIPNNENMQIVVKIDKSDLKVDKDQTVDLHTLIIVIVVVILLLGILAAIKTYIGGCVRRSATDDARVLKKKEKNLLL